MKSVQFSSIGIENLTSKKLSDLLALKITVPKKGTKRVLVSVLSPGLAQGKASSRLKNKEAAILFYPQLHQGDFASFENVRGVVVEDGGVTSPGILLARSLGIPVVSVQSLSVLKRLIGKSSLITIDSANSRLLIGPGVIREMLSGQERQEFLQSIFKNVGQQLVVFAGSMEKALETAPLGLGLAIRSEDFIATGTRQLPLFQHYIFPSKKKFKNQNILRQLTSLQIEQYRNIFKTYHDRPVIIRLYDPPFAEFFASAPRELQEENPMLGHRGVRLAITHPNLYRAQATALLTALAQAARAGRSCRLHLTVPMVSDPAEFLFVKKMYGEISRDMKKRFGTLPDYSLGVAIETPRIIYKISDVAGYADFFSFGTNDLTQLVFGFSRTDYQRFLPTYIQKKILRSDPFVGLDGVVAQLLKEAMRKALAQNPRISFFHSIKDPKDTALLKTFPPHQKYIVTAPATAPFLALSLIKHHL